MWIVTPLLMSMKICTDAFCFVFSLDWIIPIKNWVQFDLDVCFAHLGCPWHLWGCSGMGVWYICVHTVPGICSALEGSAVQ